jgi:hypothetical protein
MNNMTKNNLKDSNSRMIIIINNNKIKFNNSKSN